MANSKNSLSKGDAIRVIVETPKRSCSKYTYDPASKTFELSKILAAGLAFPMDFGFVPETQGDDGDPLDVLLLCEGDTFPGCAVRARVIGVIEAEQLGKDDSKPVRNDRLLAVAHSSRIYENVNSISDLPKVFLTEVETFFKIYNKEEGKRFTCLGTRGPRHAAKLIAKGWRQHANSKDR
jgi:inorganic pyrophosphatase